MLRKLLDGEIRTRTRNNIVQSRSFSQLLENAIKKYQNRAIEAAQVIEELIAIAKELRESERRGEKFAPQEETEEISRGAHDNVTGEKEQ